MAVRAQMDQFKLRESNFERVEFTTNASTVYLLTPGNDLGDASDSISQSSQIWFPLFSVH